MADSDLPEEVDIDGEVIIFNKQRASKLNLPVDPNRSTFRGDSISYHSCKTELDQNCESGYGSLLSHSCLSSTGSPATSFRGHNTESSTEKDSVQCNEDSDHSDVTGLSSKLSKLELLDGDDEGVDLFPTNTRDGNLQQTVDENFDFEDAFTDEDGDGDTILHNTILNEMISVVFCLVEICPRVSILNSPNKLFQTPLHLAVLTNLSEVVRKLVCKGADVLVRDQQGNTPLHIACRTGNKEIVEAVVESVKSDAKCLHKLFTLKNSEGLTCLHIAAERKHYIIMGYLMANGADVNIGDGKSGRTILHYAVERRDMETVKVLLTHRNIDVDCVTFKGESPLVIAYWRNYQDIVKKLRSKGAFFSFDLVDEWDEEEPTL